MKKELKQMIADKKIDDDFIMKALEKALAENSDAEEEDQNDADSQSADEEVDENDVEEDSTDVDDSQHEEDLEAMVGRILEEKLAEMKKTGKPPKIKKTKPKPKPKPMEYNWGVI